MAAFPSDFYDSLQYHALHRLGLIEFPLARLTAGVPADNIIVMAYDDIAQNS